jgi:hypothetical protein
MVLVLCGLIYYFAFGVIKATYLIPMKVELSDSLGMSGDRDKLDFGRIRPEGWSMKSIDLHNAEDYPVQVILTPEGNISPYLVMPWNYLWLNASQNLTVDIWVQTPPDIPHGIYTGRLRVIMRR